MPLWVRGLRSKDIRHRVDRCLNVVGLDAVRDFYPVRLSTGDSNECRSREQLQIALNYL